MMSNVRIVYNGMKYLFDPQISLKAKGVMALLVAYTNSGRKNLLVLEDVRELSCDGVTAFKNAISELSDHGYFEKVRGGNGFAGSPWKFVLKE